MKYLKLTFLLLFGVFASSMLDRVQWDHVAISSTERCETNDQLKVADDLNVFDEFRLRRTQIQKRKRTFFSSFIFKGASDLASNAFSIRIIKNVIGVCSASLDACKFYCVFRL